MNFPLVRDSDGDLILVTIRLNNQARLTMVLDTGCSITTFDSNALHIAGYDLENAIGTQLIETANGIVETEVFEIQNLTALGITKNNFPVLVYDFLAHGMLSNYQGLIGMDFFEGTKFCIDTVRNQITIEPFPV